MTHLTSPHPLVPPPIPCHLLPHSLVPPCCLIATLTQPPPPTTAWALSTLPPCWITHHPQALSLTQPHLASTCLQVHVCTHTDSESACICMLPCMRSLSPSLPSCPHCVMCALGHPPTLPHASECMCTCSLELTLAVFLALGTSVSPALPCLAPALALSQVLALSHTPQNGPHPQQQCSDDNNVTIMLLQSSRCRCDHSHLVPSLATPSHTLSCPQQQCASDDNSMTIVSSRLSRSHLDHPPCPGPCPLPAQTPHPQ